MEYAEEIFRTHPQPMQTNVDAVLTCLRSLDECARACAGCADACLGETMVADLVRCVRLDLDCADVSAATLAVLSRQTEQEWQLGRELLEACATACRLCADECEEHARMHEHCRVCAEACRQCQEACERLLESLSVKA